MTCFGSVTFTDEQLHDMASTADDLVVSAMQFGSYPDVGIPKGLRADCPKCGREQVLVKPFCTGGGGPVNGPRIWNYELRGH